MHIEVESAEAMTRAVEAVLTRVRELPKESAAVVALSGDLGAGKTTFVQTLARTLGVSETVTSPTYVIMKAYELLEARVAAVLPGFQKLIHIDAYRIETLDEMKVLRLSELLEEKDTIICIEWPEHIAPLLPPAHVNVLLRVQDEGRAVTIS